MTTTPTKAKAPTNAALRVVCYYRMSSDEQRGSIEQQRRECRDYAARMGWKIVREYADEGLSGSKDPSKRVQFQQMIADSAARGWSAVLVWDTSRFSRQDPLEAAEAKRTLRDNGVHLETVTEGRIDYATPMGRMIDFVRSEQNHDYSVKLGGNSVRGRMDVARQGYWPHGNIPYGFDRQYWGDGKPAGTFTRAEAPARAKGWKLKLIPNPTEAEAVQWLFHNFASRDMSLRQLALEVSKRGAPLPQCGRGTWNKDVIKDILLHPAYVGDTPIGSHRRSGQQRAFNRCESIVVPDTHPAIIDRCTWGTCGEKLRKLRETGRRVHSHKSSPLSGVVVCGHCGYRMAKIVRAGRTVFRCQSATSRPGLGCRQWVAREAELLELVRRELVPAIDLEVLNTAQATPPKPDAAEVEALKARQVELARKVERGTDNLLLADPGIFPKMRAALEDLEAELADVRAAVARAESIGRGDELAAMRKWWESTRANLIPVVDAEWGEKDPGESVTLAVGRSVKYLRPTVTVQPDVLRELLHRLGARVVLHWVPNGRRYFKLDYARVKAEFVPGNSLEGGTSTTTASFSPPAARGASCSRG